MNTMYSELVIGWA